MGAIKEVPEQDYEYLYRCKRCGNNMNKQVSLTTHKFGGPDLGSTKMRVCANCKNGSELTY
ncbi:MAG: hypothetical protein ACQEP1_02550 [Nanobdellota archaeon]